MKIVDFLSKEQKQQLNKMAADNKQKPITKRKIKPKKQEQLSQKDIEELMGMHMDTYTRRNGAVRRK